MAKPPAGAEQPRVDRHQRSWSLEVLDLFLDWTGRKGKAPRTFEWYRENIRASSTGRHRT